MFIQNILKVDTSNTNMTKYKEKYINLRKNLSIKARAITKSIIILETSKYTDTKVTEFKHVIQWYKTDTTTEEDKLQCLYTVFTRDIIEKGLAQMMEDEKIKYLDDFALPSFISNKRVRGNGFVGDIFTAQVKARRDTVS